MEGIKRWRRDVSRIPDYTEAMFDLFIFFLTISWEGEDKIRLAALPYFPRRYAYFQIYLRVRVQSERGERKKSTLVLEMSMASCVWWGVARRCTVVCVKERDRECVCGGCEQEGVLPKQPETAL
jgi:hypothetical protein